MKRPILCALLVLFALVSGVSTLHAAEVSYDLGVYSHYVWRGLTLTDDPSFQPAVTVSHESGFSVNVWGNMDLGDANDLSGEFSELDATLSYGWGGDVASYSIGFIEYTFPNNFGLGTREVFFTVELDVPAAPSLSVYYDFDEIEDVYASLGFGHGIEVNEEWAINLGASIAYAGDGFAALSGGVDSGFHDWNASVAFDYSGEKFSAGIMAAYTDSVDDKVLAPDPARADLWGGVYTSISF